MLVVTQVTLSLLLLIGAGLFIRTLAKSEDPARVHSTENLIAFAVDPSLNGYDVATLQTVLPATARGAAKHTPGVHSAALASVPILYGWEWDSTVTVEGYEAKPGEDMNPLFNSISPGYFETLGIPVLTGRDFRDSDTQMVVHHVDPQTGKEYKVPSHDHREQQARASITSTDRVALGPASRFRRESGHEGRHGDCRNHRRCQVHECSR